MDARYRYGQRPGRRRRTRVLIVLCVSLLIVGSIGAIIYYDIRKNRPKPVAGAQLTIIQALGDSINNLTINEPTFSMELPSDWKEFSRQISPTQHSITWRATKKNEDNRLLTVYVDTIPTTQAVNRLLPVDTAGVGITIGDISDNCATFTDGGTLNTAQAEALKPAPAKWQKVDFICNLPQVTDNVVGTGSTEGVNTVTVTGPTQGAHKYFFLYTDHNIQPNYTILDDAIKSFKAK